MSADILPIGIGGLLRKRSAHLRPFVFTRTAGTASGGVGTRSRKAGTSIGDNRAYRVSKADFP